MVETAEYILSDSDSKLEQIRSLNSGEKATFYFEKQIPK